MPCSSRQRNRMVREHIPLEQGLRLFCAIKCFLNYSAVREHIPLEQGLRLDLPRILLSSLIVREHIPLEQGLRPLDLIILIGQ